MKNMPRLVGKALFPFSIFLLLSIAILKSEGIIFSNDPQSTLIPRVEDEAFLVGAIIFIAFSIVVLSYFKNEEDDEKRKALNGKLEKLETKGVILGIDEGTIIPTRYGPVGKKFVSYKIAQPIDVPFDVELGVQMSVHSILRPIYKLDGMELYKGLRFTTKKPELVKKFIDKNETELRGLLEICGEIKISEGFFEVHVPIDETGGDEQLIKRAMGLMNKIEKRG